MPRMPRTLPGDTIPLAHTVDQVQQIVLSKKPQSAKLVAIIDVLSEPGLNSVLDRIIPERAERR